MVVEGVEEVVEGVVSDLLACLFCFCVVSFLLECSCLLCEEIVWIVGSNFLDRSSRSDCKYSTGANCISSPATDGSLSFSYANYLCFLFIRSSL